jgi:hypothetical protein
VSSPNIDVQGISYGLIAFYLFIYIAVLGVGTLWHLQRFLQYIKCIIFDFPPSAIPLYPPPPPTARLLSNQAFCGLEREHQQGGDSPVTERWIHM